MTGKLVYSNEKVAGMIASKMMEVHGGAFNVLKTPQGFEVTDPGTFVGAVASKSVSLPAVETEKKNPTPQPKAEVKGVAVPSENLTTPFAPVNGWAGITGTMVDPKNQQQLVVYYGYKCQLVGNGKTFLTVLGPNGKLISFGKSTLLSFSIDNSIAHFRMDHATAKKRGLL